MRFSVVIPARNGEKYLAQALSSVLNQHRQPDEIILIDDASEDSTAAVARSHEFAERVEYRFNAVPTGFVDAWNRAIGAATGDFVTILHQDDLLEPEYLAQVERALKMFPGVRHVYAACRYIDGLDRVIKEPPGQYSSEPVLYSGREYAHAYLSGVAANNHIHRCPGVTTSRELLLNKCTYRKEAGHIADDDFFLRVGAFTDVVGFTRSLASYRQHEDSTTSRLDLLSHRLACDYLFQSRWYRENPGLLDKTDVTVINRLAVRFINLLLSQALHYGNDNWRQEALRFGRELEAIVPGCMAGIIPAWARPMWSLAARDKSGIAGLYVRFLHAVIHGRDLLRGRQHR